MHGRTTAERRAGKARGEQARRLKRCDDALSYATKKQLATIERAYPDRAALCQAVGDDALFHSSPREAVSLMLRKAGAA